MGLLDQFRKNKQEQKQKENPTTPPPAGHTLDEVLKDRNKSLLFYELLGREKMDALAERLRKGELAEGDVELLEEQREAFSKKITQAERIEKLLTVESVIDLARNNPDFQKVINQLTPEKAIKAITSQLREISINDEDRFNVIYSLLEAKESYKSGEYRETEEKVEKLLKEKGITSKEYLDAIAIKDPDEKEEALRQLSHKANTGIKRAINGLSRLVGKNWAKDTTLEELNESEATLRDADSQLDIQSRSIGDALFMSINENKAMRDSFGSELVGEKTPNESKAGFKELRKETLDEGEWNENWVSEKQQTSYDTQPEETQKNIKNMFIERAKENYRKKHEGKGFLHRIILIWIEGLIDNKKDKLE